MTVSRSEIEAQNRRLTVRVSDLVAELERQRRKLKRGQLAQERQMEAEEFLPVEEARRSMLKAEVSELRKARDKQLSELEVFALVSRRWSACRRSSTASCRQDEGSSRC
jgi:hypothetical protein